jgi:hypothetical protein
MLIALEVSEHECYPGCDGFWCLAAYVLFVLDLGRRVYSLNIERYTLTVFVLEYYYKDSSILYLDGIFRDYK